MTVADSGRGERPAAASNPSTRAALADSGARGDPAAIRESRGGPDADPLAGSDPAVRARIAVLLASVGLIAICAIIFELLIASLSTYLYGNSIYQFSLTIGVYLSSMGLGSWLSQHIKEDLLGRFVAIELLVGAVGGCCVVVLFMAFGGSDETTLFRLTMMALTVLIGTGVGFEIPLLIRIIKGFRSLPVSVANVLAADYVGSLVGSIAFPLVLLVTFGLVQTSFLVGLLNVIVAMVTLSVFYRSIRYALPLAISGGLLGVGLAVAAGSALPISARLERHLYRDPVDQVEQSPYQRLVMTRGEIARHARIRRSISTWPERRRNPFIDGEGSDFRLFLDGDLQMSSVDEYRYHEALVHPKLSALVTARGPRDLLDVLILGGGDGLAAREVLRYPQVRTITLVELDNAVVNLATQHRALRALNRGSLGDPRVQVTYGDAFQYLIASSQLFDFVIVDLPDPDVPALSKLYSVTFYRAVEAHLADGGLAVTQSTSPYFMPRAFWCVHETLVTAGLTPSPYAVYVPSFGLWGFNLAGRRAIDPTTLSLALDNTAYLTDPVMRSLFALGRDVRRVPVEPNTLDRPIIVSYYYHDEPVAQTRAGRPSSLGK